MSPNIPDAAPATETVGLAQPLPAAIADRPALLGAQTLTYRELTDRVEAFAAALAAIAAGPGERVAIWLEKQPAYVVAILGTLRAGCAYVPLDAAQPPSRVETILVDSEPVALVTDQAHLAAVAGRMLPKSIRTIVVDGDAEAVTPAGGPRVETWEEFAARASAPAAPPPTDGTTLAAVLYTSGSTGVPKGVMISHGSLANFVGWARAEMHLGPDDVFANHASFTFDLSTFDLFAALSAGAALWVISDREQRDVSALAEGIARHGVTVWYSVPSILRLLTASGALTAEAARSLRYVLFAGEVFPITHLRALTDLLPADVALYNLYGPTETNVCTYHRVTPADLSREQPVPIGLPITRTRASILDADGRALTGPDAVGELVIEGDCVTPGYWGRGGEPIAAQHRDHRHPTGDIVSLEQGRFVYRGRKDRMVKLSGYRVELGEVEAAVLRHPQVEEAAVVVRHNGERSQLTLYYTSRDAADRPSLLELKRHCARFLPAYMVPHAATCLDALPRNANGKTDYRRLADEPATPVAVPASTTQ
ncbi:MAG TPA: amino acid adenylation domain-containing protein [Actinocrinis sp.]|nr:amino acid adenylation domain-containing protein [Actinocrinis sp.]